jgi:hypothetical protein
MVPLMMHLFNAYLHKVGKKLVGHYGVFVVPAQELRHPGRVALPLPQQPSQRSLAAAASAAASGSQLGIG